MCGRRFRPVLPRVLLLFPYNTKLCRNGNEWAKHQTEQAQIEFTALDNGFRRGAGLGGGADDL